MEPKIDFRIQGIPRAAVEQDEDNRTRLIRRLLRQFKNHPNKDALITDLQNIRTYNPFSAEPEKMVHNMENMECFEFFEISHQIQFSYFSEVLDRRHCLLHLWVMFDSHGIHKTAD